MRYSNRLEIVFMKFYGDPTNYTCTIVENGLCFLRLPDYSILNRRPIRLAQHNVLKYMIYQNTMIFQDMIRLIRRRQ
jgi:hypothetical protein